MRINRVWLITELAKRDMTQIVLAKKAGLSKYTINGICRGRTCTEETARKIADALGVKLTDVVGTELSY